MTILTINFTKQPLIFSCENTIFHVMQKRCLAERSSDKQPNIHI